MGILDFRSSTLAGSAVDANAWPPTSEKYVWAHVGLLSAFRRSDQVRLRKEAGIAAHEPYTILPLPRMISRASAGMLFGEPAEFGDVNDSDSERIAYIVEQNGLDAELVRSALISSSEGDVFGRVILRPDLLDVPIIEFVSRASVIPEFAGRFLTGATFVTEWREGNNEYMRLFERYTAGSVENTLHRGTTSAKGPRVALNSYHRTKGMIDVVSTGFDKPLCVFIPNTIDSDPTRGFSDYEGLQDRFLSINEEETIGHKNVLMTGLKRAFIDGAYVGPNGAPPRSDNFLVRKSDDQMAGEGTDPLKILEYSFEAAELISWVDHMIDLSILAAGMSPQLVGRNIDGQAISGTAMKLKMAHALIESSGKGRYLDRGVKQLLAFAKIIDSRRMADGGFGRSYRDVFSVPSMQRAEALPRDDQEAAQRVVLLTNADAISLEERVRFINPDWSEKQVGEEVDRIKEETSLPTVGSEGDIPGVNQPPTPTVRPSITLPPGGPEPGAAQ